MNKIKILFVCLGNICRSPLAEGYFRHLVEERGLAANFEIDSCGTGNWHAGNAPDPGSIKICKKHGIDISSLAARQFEESDLKQFDYIVAMDKSNHEDVLSLGDPQGELFLLREYDPFKTRTLNVPDPYGLMGDAFQEVYDIVSRCCDLFLDELQKKHELK